MTDRLMCWCYCRGCALSLASVAWLAVFGLAAAGAAERQQLNGGHVPVAVARLTPVGNLPASQQLNLAIGLPLRNQGELDTLLQQLYDPASPNYHRYLTPEQFTERFGPTENDYEALMDFANANGLTVTVTHPNRVVLDVAGSVPDIEKTFHVTLRVYQHPIEARTFYAPDVEPSVDFAVPILHISGLDNYALPHPNLVRRPPSVSANATPNSGSGPNGPSGTPTYWGSDFRTAYVPDTSLTGTGQSVGLLEFDGFYASDITTYESQARLPDVPLTVVPVQGGIGTPGSGAIEVSLDIEMAISMAPGLSQVYVYEAPNNTSYFDDLLSRMANDNLAKQLSCSWGGGGPDATAETIFKQMASQGQSFFNASGDSDAFTGSIPFPSDSPSITEVGGTTLTTSTGGAYSSETNWNWGYYSNCSCYVGSSGGISTYYSIPSYQQGLSMSANLGSTTLRNVPDVALTADNVWVIYGGGQSGEVGGTSCAAPLWAAFTALVNQQAVSAGQTNVGFLNPALYTLGKSASYTSDFHDITIGNNFWPSSPSKFPAVTGYDLCTGWGTPNGINLINALTAPPVPVPLIVSNSFTLVAESCPNGAIDPGETVTVSFSLKNIGTGNTTNLVATLLAAGGILSPSGPQTYGVVSANGAPVAQPFTFTASGTCGGTNTATFQLQDGAASLGTITFSFPLGLLTVATVFSQNFDGVTAPALPAGWASSASNAQSAWVTSTAAYDTPHNSAFSPDPASVGVNELDSPSIILPAGSAQLSFRQYYNLESGYDGGVLEIKIGGGSWTDIVTAGGSFVSGGYNISKLPTRYKNPLGGRSAWTGNSGGFITTLVTLPATASGQTIQLRWRCGSDNSNSGPGWYVDTVSIITSGYACCTSAPPAVTAQPNSQAVIAGTNVTFQVAVTGTTPLAYQWGFNGTNLAGASGASLTLTNVQAAQAGTYTVLVSNTYGSVLSSNAILTVLVPPAITVPPSNQTAVVGTSASFTVTATGTTPLAYQWTFQGAKLPGATATTLLLTGLQATQAGSYAVVVTNTAGSITSAVASLTVLSKGAIIGLSLSNGTSVSITFASQAGLNYLLEYKNTLTDSTWTLLGPTVTATGSVLVLQDTNTPVASRFYRVLRQ